MADIKRNFDNFSHAWVAHPDGNEYLLCGEDYQGYTVIGLRSGEMVVHFPPEAFKGGGFCWADALPSPDGLTLAVFGCFWACPYELVFFDFSNPMQLPLTGLARISDCDDTVGWESARSFKYVTEPHSSGVAAVWNRSWRFHRRAAWCWNVCCRISVCRLPAHAAGAARLRP